jgi:hypothetical protein
MTPFAVLAQEYNDGTLPAPGWLGFGLVALLGLAVYFLYRSMNKQLRRVPASFDEPESSTPAGTVSADDDEHHGHGHRERHDQDGEQRGQVADR